METFTNIRALIIDMDGVLWHGAEPMPGLCEFFQTLRELRIPFILATNNARSTAAEYIIKLAKMGVTVVIDEVLTSSMATAQYLSEHFEPQATKVYVVGEAGATEPLLAHGFTLTCLYEPGADLVVCGMDQTITWDKLATATLNIRAGAMFVGTNGDVTLPTERGQTHGNGAILAALQAATDVKPLVIGKPEPIMYQQALSILGADPATTVAIGDRLDTDILGAVRTGIRSLMVLSGVSTEQDLAVSDFQPTWVLPDIIEVTKALRGESVNWR
ncbi:MAG: HAD-IIA family hydrolase [Methylococcaceae bacterium]|nr:HAD-IIA family hydrolase [Methylococcaceae bacterium]MDZ4156895.1 HAD-IIA family hydrolase [Methylococcales bacterium]MDP2394057.1 HAD-IIA family hydrolase [Methylococcaceae bacterium]MDP3018479.1 HAD-IIA family hydrolase [Methylococcaceae bacterium]MDP3390995.1 HAD-IIA family hydrolase [Methylococcaceae bacterium]